MVGNHWYECYSYKNDISISALLLEFQLSILNVKYNTRNCFDYYIVMI